MGIVTDRSFRWRPGARGLGAPSCGSPHRVTRPPRLRSAGSGRGPRASGSSSGSAGRSRAPAGARTRRSAEHPIHRRVDARLRSSGPSGPAREQARSRASRSRAVVLSRGPARPAGNRCRPNRGSSSVAVLDPLLIPGKDFARGRLGDESTPQRSGPHAGAQESERRARMGLRPDDAKILAPQRREPLDPGFTLRASHLDEDPRRVVAEHADAAAAADLPRLPDETARRAGRTSARWRCGAR